MSLWSSYFHSHAIRRKWGPVLKGAAGGEPEGYAGRKIRIKPLGFIDPQRIDSVNLKLLNLLKILQLRFYSFETMQFSIFKHIL